MNTKGNNLTNIDIKNNNIVNKINNKKGDESITVCNIENGVKVKDLIKSIKSKNDYFQSYSVYGKLSDSIGQGYKGTKDPNVYNVEAGDELIVISRDSLYSVRYKIKG